jgi:cation diffusion facilitator family transporter
VTSFGAMIGLVLTGLTGKFWIDPVIALVITSLIFWIAMQIARDAVMMLSDASLPANEEQELRNALESDPHVLGYHKLRTRKSGSHRYVDVHVQIDDRLSFVDAHQYTEDIEDKLRATLRNLHPIIHAEPFEAERQHQREAHHDDSTDV